MLLVDVLFFAALLGLFAAYAATVLFLRVVRASDGVSGLVGGAGLYLARVLRLARVVLPVWSAGVVVYMAWAFGMLGLMVVVVAASSGLLAFFGLWRGVLGEGLL